MGADFAYSVVYLLGGEYAAHLLDYALLLLMAALLYYAMRRWVSRGVGFLLLGLFASTPMVQLVTGSLFVENLLAAMVVGMMSALWRFGATGEKRFLYLAAVLGGVGHGRQVRRPGFRGAGRCRSWPSRRRASGNPWARVRPRCARWRQCCCVTLAAPPYAIAYRQDRQSAVSLFDDKIRSPLIPAERRDGG